MRGRGAGYVQDIDVTSFALDQMRKDLTLRYLREHEMAVCEVAYLLGFSESSALHRAFKRWTGTTPITYRESE